MNTGAIFHNLRCVRHGLDRSPIFSILRTRCLSSIDRDSSKESVRVLQTKVSDRSSSAPVEASESDISHLVDSLLAYTRQLMDSPTTSSQLTHKKHVIAFSGGVDSSLVAQLLHLACGPDEQVTAVLGISAAVPQQQQELALRMASHIGISFDTVATNEGSDATYVANAGQACYACKTHLYRTLRAIHNHETSSVTDGSASHKKISSSLLYNGTNADDMQDPTRVGLVAAQEFQVLSPLRHTPKDQVRLAAKRLGLPNWDYAASPCLRSRLALGVPATEEHLRRIEFVETLIREALAIDATVNLRARLFSRNRACIEIDEDWLDVAEKVDLNRLLAQAGRDAWCFDAVNVRTFKSGSVAAVPVEPTVIGNN